MAERHGERVVVDFAMRYGNPSTASVIDRLRGAGCERIVFFPLYPQYSAPTTATANDEAFRALMALRWQPAIRTVPAYHDHPLYIEALARSVEAAYAGLDAAAGRARHQLPRDAASATCARATPTTASAGRRRGCCASGSASPSDGGGRDFQSRFGREEWLKPYTVEEVGAAGAGREAAHRGDGAGLRGRLRRDAGGDPGRDPRAPSWPRAARSFTYIPCLNADPAHIEMMVAILERELAGWL